MPYLHLDLPLAVPGVQRRRIAGRLARLYAGVMETDLGRVTVAFRELGDYGVVHTGADGESETLLMVQCDIRRGRPTEQRERLASAISDLLAEELDWPPERTVIEFTQHAGNEFWRAAGLSADWTPAEMPPAADDRTRGGR